jgi:hypothetical protein
LSRLKTHNSKLKKTEDAAEWEFLSVEF